MLKKNFRKKALSLRKKKFNSSSKINLFEITNIIKKKNLKKPIIGGYFPVNYEIDCLNILRFLDKKGIKISLPSIKKNNQMKFYYWSFKDPLILNKFGIPEPIPSTEVYPDILLVPIVAFDRLKYRVGYGGGYYDRYLDKISKIKNYLSIGFAFSFQKINKVPKNKYDKKLDYILTEKYLIK